MVIKALIVWDQEGPVRIVQNDFLELDTWDGP